VYKLTCAIEQTLTQTRRWSLYECWRVRRRLRHVTVTALGMPCRTSENTNSKACKAVSETATRRVRQTHAGCWRREDSHNTVNGHGSLSFSIHSLLWSSLLAAPVRPPAVVYVYRL